MDCTKSILRQVAAAQVREYPAVGLGKTLRLQATGMVGVGLWRVRIDSPLTHGQKR
jgi:hypothetical protein